MLSLDSLYAMLAKPMQVQIKSKNKVKRLESSAAMTPDSHEDPQSQLPPHLERRSGPEDRRKQQQIAFKLDPRLERRKGPRRDKQLATAEAENTKTVAEEQHGVTHTRIDIDV